MKPQRLQKPTNIRFPEPVNKRLKIVADRFGVTQSDLVRNAVIEKIEDWERSGQLVFKAAKAG